MAGPRLSVTIAFLCFTVLFVGCSAGPIGSAPDPHIVANSPIVAEQGDGGALGTSKLRFAPGDKIKVVVFGEESLTGEYEVDAGGSITLPLAGSIKADGLTRRELERSITKHLKRADILDPRVTVEGTDFRPFYVLGEVNKPGAYPYRAGLNVLSAIAIAGGVTYRASTSKVWIQRSGSTELKKYPHAPNVLIMPGDVVKVPERYF